MKLARFETDASLRAEDGADDRDAKGGGSASRRSGLRSAGHRRLAAQPSGGGVDFSRHAEHVVDSLRQGYSDASYAEVQRILANIRKQYDEVHCEVGKREQELLAIRRNIHLTEAEKVPLPDTWRNMSREQVQRRMDRASVELEEALETRQVYRHVVARLKRELGIVQQKVNIMEEHLRRKTTEAERRQACSRRLHQEKVACINALEAMELDIEVEREVCSSALEDLEATSKLRQDEVRHRKDFERWRYDVAAEAAGEAFQATAGRFWKIYAVEKLTGNCLQKLSFEQLETSQMTEDGFQKIREVTGLTDVMDIVHKFLNRDVEHEQLRLAVREAESRLQTLREREANLRQENGGLAALTLAVATEDGTEHPGRLHVDVEQGEGHLAKAQQGHEDLRRRQQRADLLFQGIKHWAQRVARSFAPLDDLGRVERPGDVVPFFRALAGTVERFLDQSHADLPSTRLSRLTGQAAGKEHAEQQRLLSDREFLRLNCRVPASLDAHSHHDELRRGSPRGELADRRSRSRVKKNGRIRT